MSDCINRQCSWHDWEQKGDFVTAIMLFHLFLTVHRPFASLLTRGYMNKPAKTFNAKVINRVW